MLTCSSREPAPKGPPARGEFKLIVENVSSSTSWQDLKDFARKSGNVLFSDVWTTEDDKLGLIEYESKEELEDALKNLDGFELAGNRLRLVPDDGRRPTRGGRRRDDNERKDASPVPRSSPRGSPSRGSPVRSSPRREEKPLSGSRSPSRSRSRSPREDRSPAEDNRE